MTLDATFLRTNQHVWLTSSLCQLDQASKKKQTENSSTFNGIKSMEEAYNGRIYYLVSHGKKWADSVHQNSNSCPLPYPAVKQDAYIRYLQPISLQNTEHKTIILQKVTGGLNWEIYNLKNREFSQSLYLLQVHYITFLNYNSKWTCTSVHNIN